MKLRILPAVASLLAGLPCPVSAQGGHESIPVASGVEGLTKVSFRVANRTAAPLACAAALAHWYSTEIGRAEPGADVTADLWSDPKTGTVYLLNVKAERMPVLSLWCGRDGAAASTRSDIRLARRRGEAEPSVRLICRERDAGGARPDCRSETD